MKKIQLLIVSFILTFALVPAVQAAILDFSTFDSGNQGTNALDVGDATINITSPNRDIFVYSPEDFDVFGIFQTSGGFCARQGAGGDCARDATLTFDFEVTNLGFEFASFKPGDSALVTALYGLTNVGSQQVGSNGNFSFGGAVITSLVFDDLNSSGGGFAWGEFSYDKNISSAPIPVPATVWLFGTALIGLVGFGKRRKTS